MRMKVNVILAFNQFIRNITPNECNCGFVSSGCVNMKLFDNKQVQYFSTLLLFNFGELV